MEYDLKEWLSGELNLIANYELVMPKCMLQRANSLEYFEHGTPHLEQQKLIHYFKAKNQNRICTYNDTIM